MRDYEKLVKALRCCSKIDARNNGCDSCPYEYCGEDCQNLCGNAADAIEELIADVIEAFSADIISMQNAVETDAWLMVRAVEPNRKIHVQMTYDELWKIVQMERENMIKPPKEVE